ncbi:hypothetical protein PT974_05900 [Cladobotryum mycophilum]|uniref:DUF7707 domain-containing protein n=1 Tax=Cladobotryum mycophilum TaxID=491253 RepID=A0ABR0SK45_9HYPO
MLFRSAVLAVAAVFTSVAQADYQIDPKTVPLSTRQAWCDSEKSVCPIICQQFPPGTTLVNQCDSTHLTYGCLCGNNKQPNISEYSLTLPYFVCTEFGNQCVKACGQDNTCASACRENNPCGATNPKRYNTTETASIPAATTTSDDGTVFTGTPGETGSASHPGKKGAAPALEVGRAYGLFIVLGSMFVGFAML